MIETKEQYEELQLMRLLPKHGPPVGKATHKPLFETIEALREVARQMPKVHNPVLCEHNRISQAEASGYLETTGPEPCEVCDAIDALPDWLTDG